MVLSVTYAREFIASIDALEAVLAVRRAERDTAKLRARTGRAFRNAWVRQGNAFIKGFASLRTSYTKSETPAESRAYPGRQVTRLETATISEAELSENDWRPIFTDATLATLEVMTNAIQTASEEALKLGARDAIAQFEIDASFTLQNPRAVAYLEGHAAEMVTRINEETRTQLRTLLSQSAEEGWSYTRTQREIRRKFQGFGGKSPLLHIRNRAELVAVTEVGNAYEAGNYMVAAGLQDRGLIMEKHWYDAGDDRVHKGCQVNTAAGWIPINNLFPSGVSRPLDHPGCRCHCQYRRKADERPNVANPEMPEFAPGTNPVG